MIFLSLLITNIILNNTTIELNICVPKYDTNTVLPIIFLNLVFSFLDIGWASICIKKLRYLVRSVLAFEDDSSLWELKQAKSKFIVLDITMIITSFVIFLSSIFGGYVYGILLSVNALIIIIINVIMYRKYDRIFRFLFKCILPPVPPDRVKNLQQIVDLFQHEYTKNYQSFILKLLNNNQSYHIPQDVVSIIMEFIQPITNLEESIMYKPYWTNVIQSSNVNTESMQNMQYWKCSKYGGVPYLRSCDKWPSCSKCGHKLYLYLQLNMDTLPDEYTNLWLYKNGQPPIYNNFMLQYFHCISSACLNGNIQIYLIQDLYRLAWMKLAMVKKINLENV